MQASMSSKLLSSRFLGSLLLVSSFLDQAKGDLSISNYGYQDLLVTISPDVPEDDSVAIIDGIKEWIDSGSKVLYGATEKKAYIDSVKILIPDHWTMASVPTGEVTYQDGHIQVNPANPVYGNSPYTVQAGGCLSKGELIHVTPEYLRDLSGSSTNQFGPPSHVFVHEWSKFRYGVFDEYGYPGDDNYPVFYVNPRDQTEILPNFCTVASLNGEAQDMTTGGQCVTDPVTGLPDSNCIFVPSGENDFAQTSLLSTPFLEATEYYCNCAEEIRFHNDRLPNKQNEICNLQSTFDVVMQSPDMKHGNGEWENAPNTTFEILKQEVGKFVLVLDASLSMENFDRIDYLKQSTMRWIKYDIQSGSFLGIVKFNSEGVELQAMQEVTDDNRDESMQQVDDIELGSYTCLGAAVKKGIEIMGRTGPGGVMIFFTDGKQECDEKYDDSTITDPEVIELVEESGIRIITIAIGPSADKDIESLADLSNGKTYFVPDESGLGNINDALSGCLTYQPAVPTEDMEFVIFKESYETVVGFQGEFFIDSSIGRDVEIQIDYVVDSEPGPIEKITVSGPEGFMEEFQFVFDASKVFLVSFDTLEEGEYTFNVSTSNQETLDYSYVIVKSKAKEGEEFPFKTNCWFSTADGSNEADLSLGDPLAVVAEVYQGTRPVMNARVRAFIESENDDQPLEQDLYDNGAGPDLVANDGLYSRYFTQFNGDTRYLLRCQVEGTEETEVNGGFTVTKRNEEDSYSYSLSGNPPCCGSNALQESFARAKSGKFYRSATGGSIQVTKAPGILEDPFPPSQVRNLKSSKVNATIVFTFTAPGDDYDEGTAETYNMFVSVNQSTILMEEYQNASKLTDADFQSGNLTPVPGGGHVELVLDEESLLAVLGLEELLDTYYFRMEFVDDQGLRSRSNVVTVVYSSPRLPGTGEITTTGNTFSPGEIAGIVIGTLAGVAILLLAVWYFVVKRKRS